MIMDQRLGHGRSGGSRLWPIYVFSFLNSIGTGVVTNGIVFFTKQSYHFSDTQNYLLAVVLGVTYIAGALLAQPGGEWTRAKWGWSSRGILAGVVGGKGVVLALPGGATGAQGF